MGLAAARSTAPADEGTIAAVSTAPGRAAIAVIRLSGPASGPALRRLAGRLPEPRRAMLARFRDTDGMPLDRGLALWFPGPASATGEDMAELHVHGGPAVVSAVLAAACRLPGVRLAEPGDFTRRAFLNGKMDLSAVEGLADLLAAETEGQRRLALGEAEGRTAARVEGWRRELVRAMALVEAGIDFPEEEDVPAGTRRAAREVLQRLAGDLAATLADARGEALREGFRVAIAGRPNAGKSSLINALARRDVAIVTEEPGTTRDVLEVKLDLGGYAAIVADTAGLREAPGVVEREGVRRARARMREAHLVLWVHDLAEGPVPPLAALDAAEAPALWIVANKADRVGAAAVALPPEVPGVVVSVARGDGIDDLVARLTRHVAERLGAGEHPALVRARHREAVNEALTMLRATLALWEELPDELLAEHLRGAAAALGRVTGRIGVEDVLDSVFSEFCIGK